MKINFYSSSNVSFLSKGLVLILLAFLGFTACEFEEPIPTYTLTTSVSPNEGGKITRSPELPNYKAGDVVTLTPEPNEHWVFKQWDGDATGNNTPLQISMNSNKSITGVFVKRDYPLNIKIEGQGTVEEKIIPNPSGREYPHGTRVELKPIPKEGWVFESWGGDLSGNETPQIITVDKEKNVVVKFKRRDYPLNITITGEGTVEEKIVSVPGGKTYPFETVVELKPIPKLGWVFESWGGDLTGTDATKIITVDKEKIVTVKFKRKDYPLNITISGEGTVEEKIVSSPGGRSYPYQTVVELAPKPKEGWVFEGWAGDLTGNEAPKNITVDKEKNVTAKFKRRDYPLNLTIEGEGLIEEKIVYSPGDRTYPFQTVVELTPKPKDGWVFESWGGDLTGNEVPKTITVDKEKNVTVKFKTIVSIEMTNSFDTIVISNKLKFDIKGNFSDGSSINLSDKVKLSSDGDRITFLGDNYFVGAKSGNAIITISYMDFVIKDEFYVNYYEEVLNNSSPFLQQNSISSDITNVPIVIINFHPTDDGLNIHPKYYTNDYFIKDRFYSYYNIDRNVCNNSSNNSICSVGTLEMYKIRAQDLHSLTKFGIEQGSKFRGFSNNTVSKSVNIQVIKYYNFYELKRKIYTGNSLPEPDYESIFSKINLEDLVQKLGVKEVWFSLPKIFADHPNILNGTLPRDYLLSIAESNMSSTFGDISNSSRFEGDLPKYGKTYVVYGVDIDRGPAEALHNRGHQIESQLSYIEKNKQWPNELFWNNFVGMRESGGPIGRAGSTHFPPNSNIDYDYRNLNLVESDIESWEPSGGQKAKINVERWRNIFYSFPDNIFWNTKAEAGENPLFSNNVKDDPHYKWLLFWFQSIPGRNNNIGYTTNQGKVTVLSNWWDIFYNWDDAIYNKRTLWKE